MAIQYKKAEIIEELLQDPRVDPVGCPYMQAISTNLLQGEKVYSK